MQYAVRILARTTGAGSKPFTIYDLRFTIFSFIPRNQRNLRLLIINRCKLVLSEAERIRVEKRQNNEKNR